MAPTTPFYRPRIRFRAAGWVPRSSCAVALGTGGGAETVTLGIELATLAVYPVTLLANTAGWRVPGLTVKLERLDSGDGGVTGAGAFDTSEQAPRPRATRSETNTVQIVCRLKNCLPIVEPR